MLPDGRYETIVIEARAEPDHIAVDLAIAAGSHRGDVVTVRMHGTQLDLDPIGLLGLPATLFVEDGKPRVVFET